MAIDTHHMKERLTTERDELVAELSQIARVNPDNPQDWEAKDTPMDIMNADSNEAADRIEERKENQALLDELEARHRSVVRALEKIENGTYGTCEIGGEPIEEDRLEANPAARTCKAHMEEEGSLSL